MEMFDGDRLGTVLRIERSSIHDGTGFRTVIFLKGCPLRCQWCSTPESQSFQIETAAGSTYGKKMTVRDVMLEIRKDSPFFFISSGGVTLSGGEILSQPAFSLAILKNCRREGYHTAIETSFFASWEYVNSILPYVNTAFVDLKLMDDRLHKDYCGASNQRILENLKKTNQVHSQFKLIIRTPIIPGINDSEAELTQIGMFCAGLKRLDHIQLLPYHRLGVSTYKKLGRDYPLPHVPVPSSETMEACRSIVKRYIANVI